MFLYLFSTTDIIISFVNYLIMYKPGWIAYKLKNINLNFSVIPESPRWLLVKNRRSKADAVLKNMAKWNKTVYPHNLPLHEPVCSRMIIIMQPLFALLMQ